MSGGATLAEFAEFAEFIEAVYVTGGVALAESPRTLNLTISVARDSRAAAASSPLAADDDGTASSRKFLEAEVTCTLYSVQTFVTSWTTLGPTVTS